MAVDQATKSIYHDEQATNTLVVVSAAAPSVNSDQYGSLKFTALATAITGIVVTGSPLDLQNLMIRILDNGTTRAITWSSQFEPVGAALLANTTAGKRHTLTFKYDATTSKWGCTGAVVEA